MTKNAKYAEMYELYLSGQSLERVGEVYDMSRQSVYAGFSRRGYKLRERKTLPYITYRNRKFTLRNTGYYAATDGKRESLHRYKYEYEIGPIPEDWDVHHIDGNKEHNNIENLVALPKDEHTYLFTTGGNQHGKGNRQDEIVGEREHRINFYIALKHGIRSNV